MKGFKMDIVITQVKEMKKPEVQPHLIATSKTQKHLRAKPSTQPSASQQVDPWTEPAKDPWGKIIGSTFR